MADSLYVAEFEKNLFATFPDVQATSTVSRKQIQTVMDKMKSTKYPTWLMQTKLGRGLYAIPGGSITAPIVGNTALAPQLEILLGLLSQAMRSHPNTLVYCMRCHSHVLAINLDLFSTEPVACRALATACVRDPRSLLPASVALVEPAARHALTI